MRFSAKRYQFLSTPTTTPTIEPLYLRGLLEGIAQGQERAFAALYQCTHSRVYATARSVLKSKQDAEEVVSDVFMYVWDNAHLYDFRRGVVMVWLAVITRNRAIDRLRRRRYDQSTDELYRLAAEHTPDPNSPECNFNKWQESRMLRRQVSALSPLRQQLLTLSFSHDFSHKTIANLLNLPRGTVKSHIRRALLGLRPAMIKWKQGYEPTFETQ
jgi:RNA polymerase sigma-70 factor (ECF subfamily)